MDTINDTPAQDRVLAESTAELRDRLSTILQQLSPERLQVLTDFAAYLADVESESATQDLLAISGLLDQVQKNQMTPRSEYVNWREVRSDV